MRNADLSFPRRQMNPTVSGTRRPADPVVRSEQVSGIRKLMAEIDRLRAEVESNRRVIRELEERSEQDLLCPTLNRLGFERELARALEHGARYGGSIALIYIDLDHFKPINDRFGHAAGDAVLVKVSTLLRIATRASDVVARLGGDEFAVILWNIDEDAALTKADTLERTLANADITVGGVTLAVGASCGVAMARPGESLAALTARADAAMYARKTERRACRGG